MCPQDMGHAMSSWKTSEAGLCLLGVLQLGAVVVIHSRLRGFILIAGQNVAWFLQLYRDRVSPSRICVLQEDVWRAVPCHVPHSAFSSPLSMYLTSFVQPRFPRLSSPQRGKLECVFTEAAPLPTVPPSKRVSFIPHKMLIISLWCLDLMSSSQTFGSTLYFFGRATSPFKNVEQILQRNQQKALLRKPPVTSHHGE